MFKNNKIVNANVKPLLHKAEQLVAVVIPVYKPSPDSSELISFRQCLKILYSYPIVLIAPQSLELNWYLDFCKQKGISVRVERFEDWYFANIRGYNKLCLSSLFYQRFIQYEYMLIYQLDAFIFADQLQYWCNQGYDYIGAPWLKINYLKNEYVKQRIPAWLNFIIKFTDQSKKVGNGGLSLRKIKSFYLNSILFKRMIKKWKLHEDIFWSFIPPLFFPFLYKVPDTIKALAFSFETEPVDCYRLNNNSLPFGCHAWEKNNYAFWKPHLESAQL